jgi:XTP/dITP diphosphohydrolase
MEILFATSNKHKFEEARVILATVGISVKHFPFSHNEIRSDSLEEIAIEAAGAAYAQTKKPVFVEDTGLFIDSLHGFPGTYSAWVQKKIGPHGILKLMEGIEKEKRSASFKTSIAFHDGAKIQCVSGECKGIIADAVKGAGGFGYDPIFIPQGYPQTFGQNIELKNKLSHRYVSLLELRKILKEAY